MSSFSGTAGNDSFSGTQNYDSFYLDNGGDDTASGRGRGDYFQMGVELTAADDLDGGSGHDSVQLTGDYSTGLVLTATTLQNIESISFTAGFSYDITTHDRTNTGSFNVQGYTLGVGDTLRFDGAAESTSSFNITGGAGDDWIRGGAGNDTIYVTYGGKDTVFGGGGNDYINAYNTGAVTAADRISGGAGLDTLYLYGDYSSGLAFSAATLTSIEQIQMGGLYDYDIVLHDAITPAGETLVVNAYLEVPYQVRLDASSETNGNVSVTGGDGADWLSGGAGDDFLSSGMAADTIIGGGGDDLINGGRGHDRLTGGTGGDTFVFLWEDSPAIPDLIKDLTNGDAIDLSSIDADPGPGYLSFTLVPGFSSTPGEMRLAYNAGSNLTKLLMDMDGDAAADMTILMSGQHTSFDNFLL